MLWFNNGSNLDHLRAVVLGHVFQATDSRLSSQCDDVSLLLNDEIRWLGSIAEPVSLAHILWPLGSVDRSPKAVTVYEEDEKSSQVQSKPKCTLLHVSNRPKDARIYINSNNFDTLHAHCRVRASRSLVVLLYDCVAAAASTFGASQSLCWVCSRCIFYYPKCDIMCATSFGRPAVPTMNRERFAVRRSCVCRCTHKHTLVISPYALHILFGSHCCEVLFISAALTLGFVLHISICECMCVFAHAKLPAFSCLLWENCPTHYTAHSFSALSTFTEVVIKPNRSRCTRFTKDMLKLEPEINVLFDCLIPSTNHSHRCSISLFFFISFCIHMCVCVSFVRRVVDSSA